MLVDYGLDNPEERNFASFFLFPCYSSHEVFLVHYFSKFLKMNTFSFEGLYSSHGGVVGQLVEESFQIEDVAMESGQLHASTVVSGGNSIHAICCGKVLSIVGESNEGKYTIDSELEFEDNIVTVAWDPEGHCILAGQSNGILHFVSRDGNLILSNSIVKGQYMLFTSIMIKVAVFLLPLSYYRFLPSGDSVGKLSSIHFVRMNGEAASLFGVTSNGEVIVVEKLPLASLCKMYIMQPAMIAKAAQSLKFQRHQLRSMNVNSNVKFGRFSGEGRSSSPFVVYFDPLMRPLLQVLDDSLAPAVPLSGWPGECKHFDFIAQSQSHLLVLSQTNDGVYMCLLDCSSRETRVMSSCSLGVSGDVQRFSVLTDSRLTEEHTSTSIIALQGGSDTPSVCLFALVLSSSPPQSSPPSHFMHFVHLGSVASSTQPPLADLLLRQNKSSSSISALRLSDECISLLCTFSQTCLLSCWQDSSESTSVEQPSSSAGVVVSVVGQVASLYAELSRLTTPSIGSSGDGHGSGGDSHGSRGDLKDRFTSRVESLLRRCHAVISEDLSSVNQLPLISTALLSLPRIASTEFSLSRSIEVIQVKDVC